MFSAGVERALRAAFDAHAGQRRKGLDDVPYATHVCHVALILARAGLDETVIQAGLLHDVVEDCPGWTFERVEREFGAEVRGLVAELTEDKSQSWEERKRWQVEHAACMSAGALAVKAADVLHNLETLAADLQRATDPEDVWGRFRGGRARTLARSAELVAALEPGVPAALQVALRDALNRLERLARG